MNIIGYSSGLSYFILKAIFSRYGGAHQDLGG